MLLECQRRCGTKWTSASNKDQVTCATTDGAHFDADASTKRRSGPRSKSGRTISSSTRITRWAFDLDTNFISLYQCFFSGTAVSTNRIQRGWSPARTTWRTAPTNPKDLNSTKTRRIRSTSKSKRRPNATWPTCEISAKNSMQSSAHVAPLLHLLPRNAATVTMMMIKEGPNENRAEAAVAAVAVVAVVAEAAIPNRLRVIRIPTRYLTHERQPKIDPARKSVLFPRHPTCQLSRWKARPKGIARANQETLRESKLPAIVERNMSLIRSPFNFSGGKKRPHVRSLQTKTLFHQTRKWIWWSDDFRLQRKPTKSWRSATERTAELKCLGYVDDLEVKGNSTNILLNLGRYEPAPRRTGNSARRTMVARRSGTSPRSRRKRRTIPKSRRRSGQPNRLRRGRRTSARNDQASCVRTQ